MDTIASTLHPVKLTHSVTAPSPSGWGQAKGKGVRKECKVKYADLQRNLDRSCGNLLHFPLVIKIHRVANMGCGLFETFPQSKSMCTWKLNFFGGGGRGKEMQDTERLPFVSENRSSKQMERCFSLEIFRKNKTHWGVPSEAFLFAHFLNYRNITTISVITLLPCFLLNKWFVDQSYCSIWREILTACFAVKWYMHSYRSVVFVSGKIVLFHLTGKP